MANWYCDHGCTLYPTAYMSVPTNSGSFPQEGDGKASGTGTTPAVSVATMDFTGATAAAGATFGVHGATLTCVASGASTVQFNAGSGSTLAANLVTAINAATASPTVTTGGVSSPYLKALVWAEASGAVLTVYSRIASSDLNQSVNASCTLVCGATGNWTSNPAASNFSGGVSGPFSRFFNNVALTAGINASISAIGTYGAMVVTMMGTPATGDVMHVRTGRSSADISVSITANTSVTFRNIGTALSYFEVRFDNGTVWSDGNSNQIFTLLMDVAGQTFTATCQGFLYWHGQMKTGTNVQSGGTVNCKFSKTSSDSSGYTGMFRCASNYGVKHTVFEGIETADTGAGTWTQGGWLFSGIGSTMSNPYQPTKFINCKFGIVRVAGGPFADQTSFGAHNEAIDCLFAYGGASQFTGALCGGNVSGNGQWYLKLVRPKFTGGGGGHHILLPAAATSGASTDILVIEDPVDMGQFILSDSAASFCGRLSGQTTYAMGGEGLAFGQFLTSNNGKRDFIIDTPRRLIEWRGGAGFPTTGLSTLPDGTAFSVRFSVPHTGLATGLVTPMCTQRGIKQVVTNTLGDSASLTVTQHLLIDSTYGGSSYTPTDAEWWIEGAYVSSTDGSTKVFTTRGTGTNLTSDSQSWSTLTGFGPFGGSPRTYSRWKIQPALTNVKANTEISLYLVCAKQPSTMVEWCIVDPEFTLA